MSILCLNIFTLLAPTQSADNMFRSLTVLCEYFLISSLHFFANVTRNPLLLLSSLTENNISVNIFIRIQYTKPLNVISSQSFGF